MVVLLAVTASVVVRLVKQYSLCIMHFNNMRLEKNETNWISQIAKAQRLKLVLAGVKRRMVRKTERA